MSNLRHGTLLAERFKIVNLLGKGGFGEVYHAIDMKEGTEVAIKIFNAAKSPSSDLTDLADECLALSQIETNSVVKVIALKEDKGSPILIQELLRGGSLAQLMNKRFNYAQKGVGLEEIVNIGVKVAEALDAAHVRNIFHGDIKPSNICFRDESHKDPVVVDFGHATFQSAYKNQSSKNSPQLEVTTLQYIAPERVGYLKSENFGAMDLYSLGVILYELSTGELPIKGTSPQELVSQLYSVIPTPICNLVPNYPRFLDDIIQKLLRKSPKDRYQSPSGLVMDLKTALNYINNCEFERTSALGRYDSLRELNYKVPLVGRKEEIKIFESAVEATMNSNSIPLMISAPSGTGKSRLASEVLSLGHAKGMKVSESKFSRFEKNVPLSAFNRILKEHSEHLLSIPKNQLNNWRNDLYEELGEYGNLLVKRLPYYSDLFPVFPKMKEDLPKEEEEKRFFDIFASFLRIMDPDKKGRIIFLDDLQWADKTSIDLLQSISWRSKKEGALNKTFIMGAFRSEEVPHDHPLMNQVLDYMNTEQHVRLGNLKQEETYDLVELLLDEKSDEIELLKKYAFQLTEGSPFYVYELLKSALSNGIFYKCEEGNWAFNEALAKSSDVIHGVDNLVTERLNSLSQTSFEVIKTASIAGSSIQVKHLCTLIEQLHQRKESPNQWIDFQGKPSNVVVNLAMDELRRKHLITEEIEVFRFFHDKIRDAAFQLNNENDEKITHTIYGNILSKSLANNGDQLETKDIFEAAFHVTAGDPTEFKELSKNTLVLAGQKATSIFAYQKAKDYLEAATKIVPQDPIGISDQPNEIAEWIMIHELYADALALSEDLHGAIFIYHKILDWEKETFNRATIFSKLASNNLFLFQYPESIDAGIKGLKELNEPYMKSEIFSLLYIAIRMPFYLVQLFLNKLFSKKSKVLVTKEEKIKWDLRISLEVPFYFTRPLAAVANHLVNAIKMLPYKDNYYKSMTNAYWGVVCANIGLKKISDKAFNRALDYFEVNHNPVSTIFITFVKGYLLNFPRGNIDLAQEQIEKATQMATEIGETFWRFLGFMGLIHLDYYGKGTGIAPAASQKLISFHNKIRFLPTVNGCVLRTLLNSKQKKDFERWRHEVIYTGNEVVKTGYISIDVVYSFLQPGEIHLLEDEPEVAIPYLRKAFWYSLVHIHRVAFCFFAPPLLALAYIRTRKRIRTLIPLAFGWINSLASVEICQPQLMMATAEWFDSIGLKSVGVRILNNAIHWASRKGWTPVIAELRLSLVRMVMKTNPDLAQSHLKKAEDIFQRRNSSFLLEKWASMNLEITKILERRYPELYLKNYDRKTTSSISGGYIRDQIDNSALLEMFRKLSVMSDLDTLLETVLETLCTCTGANYGVAYLPKDGSWEAKAGKGIKLERIQSGDYFGSGVDKEFFDHAVTGDLGHPKVRSSKLKRVAGQAAKGAVLVVPLRYKEIVSGVLYLGNSQISELFDDLNLELVSQISTQAAIALNNFSLLSTQEEKVRMETELKTANEFNLKLKDAYDQIKLLANTDPLTKLSNRRDIIDKINMEITRMKRSKKPFSIILSDIDFFKKFNDEHGHDCGDFVLVTVANQIKNLLRDQDHTARWGGEEFLLVLPETSIDGALNVAEKIRETIASTVHTYKGKDISISMTFGVTEFNMDQTLDETIDLADKALYEGKEAGRNRVVPHNPHNKVA